jgi:acyl-CoA thioesterase-1
MLAVMEIPMRTWWVTSALVVMLWAQGAAASTVLVVGDSISAGLGLETSQGWVNLMQKRLEEGGFAQKVVNASISGDTSAGGLARLPALLAEHKPALVIIELGGNDGLRGQAPAQLQQNLASMVEQSQQAGAKVLLLGMRLPPNYGERYNKAFAAAFSNLAAEKQVPLVPFFLEGVGGVPELMQADGIHPAAGAQSKLLDNAWPAVKPLL